MEEENMMRGGNKSNYSSLEKLSEEDDEESKMRK